MKRLLPFLFLLCAGCSSVAPSKALKNVFWDERPKTPGRMVALWQCYTQTNPDGDLPLRGVGGRIFFYDEKETNEPIKVDGDMTIFLFDAHDPVPQQSVPVKQAIFKKEALPVFLRKDSEGMNGYEFYVPVDEVGNEEMDLQVLAVFRDAKKSGKSLRGETQTLIHSRLTEITLPGPKRQEAIVENGSTGSATTIDLADGRDDPYGIVQASYQQRSPQQQTQQQQTPELGPRRRPSETIRLPERFAQALQYDQYKPVASPYDSSPYGQSPHPYGQSTVSEPNTNIPQFQESGSSPVPSVPATSNSALAQSTDDWVKMPGRMLDVTQRSSTPSSDKRFRIDSNTGPTPELVHEEVSKSGVTTKVWLQ